MERLNLAVTIADTSHLSVTYQSFMPCNRKLLTVLAKGIQPGNIRAGIQ